MRWLPILRGKKWTGGQQQSQATGNFNETVLSFERCIIDVIDVGDSIRIFAIPPLSLVARLRPGARLSLEPPSVSEAPMSPGHSTRGTTTITHDTPKPTGQGSWGHRRLSASLAQIQHRVWCDLPVIVCISLNAVTTEVMLKKKSKSSERDTWRKIWSYWFLTMKIRKRFRIVNNHQQNPTDVKANAVGLTSRSYLWVRGGFRITICVGFPI